MIEKVVAPIDAAFKVVYSLIKSWRTTALHEGDTELSDADTRAKLIVPIFRDVLGWPDENIVREEPYASGYVDYTFRRQGSRLILVEATKRSTSFDLQASAARQPVLIGGPQASDKVLQAAIRQAASYGASLGCPYAVVTNGVNYVVFPCFDTRPLPERYAYIFTDLIDRTQFRSFYGLLSFAAVTQGTVHDAFLSLQQVTQSIVPLELIEAPDREFRRNKLWSVMSHLATRVLEDNPDTRLEIIQNCYVTTRESQETDSSLKDLIIRPIPPLVRDSGAVSVRPTPSGRTAFGHALEGDVKERRPGVYVLTGGAGSGKTTFLTRFEHFIEPTLVAEWCVWLQIDFLASSKPEANDEAHHIAAYVFRSIRSQMSTRYAAYVPTDGEALRELFAEELTRLDRTILYGIPKDSPTRLLEQNREVDRLFTSDQHFVVAAVRRLLKTGRRIVVVLDNSDQLGEDFQERVFLFARTLTNDFSAICIVSLREEKFYAAHYRGVFNAFPTRKFHIGSPDFQMVLQRRLEYAIRLIQQETSSSKSLAESLEGSSAPSGYYPSRVLSTADCLKVLRIVLYSVTRKNRAIARMIESVSTGNIRFGLELFRDFISSANTDVEKILRIAGDRHSYIVPFHEFVRSIMLQNREFYRTGSSAVVNVFAKSAASHTSYFTSLRIVAYLHERHKSASRYGIGYVDAQQLRMEYQEAFGIRDDFDQTLGYLIRIGLIESEPPRVDTVEKVEAVKAAAAGSYYYKWLTRNFSYLDLVIFDTAYDDVQVANYLAHVARDHTMATRIERVARVLEFLANTERKELARAPIANGFTMSVMAPISTEIRQQLKGLARLHRLPEPA